jgi:hypothetical protein
MAAKFKVNVVRSIAKPNAPNVNHSAPYPSEPGKKAQAEKHNAQIAAMDRKLGPNRGGSA